MDENMEFNVDQAMNRLDEINKALAGNNVSLKDALALYKEGVALADKCNQHLIGVEKEIEVINK